MAYNRLYMVSMKCPKCGGTTLSRKRDAFECASCASSYPVIMGEVCDSFPVQGGRDSASHSYTYSYSSRFYEKARTGWMMKLTTGISYQEEKELVFKMVKPEPGQNLLDIGCGTGIFSRQFSRVVDPGEVWGLDFSYSQLRTAVRLKAEEKITNLHLVHGKAMNLPFADESFDRAVTTGAMQFFGGTGDFFREVRRVLRPGGIFVALNYLDPGYIRGKTWLLRRVQRVALRHGDHLFSKDELLGYAGEAGFAGIDYIESGITFVISCMRT
jgi:ubiquinone/menaquinone biosynthesis C-methylase UbiE